MKGFATEMSEKGNEGRVDSKRNSDMIIFYILGSMILFVCILCMFLIWQKKADRGRTGLKSETYMEVSDTILAESPDGSLSELHDTTSGDVYEIELSEYTEEETIRQQYLTDMEYLKEKVEGLLQFMSETKETLEEVVIVQEEDDALKEQVSEITSDITQLTIQLQNAQKRILELKESITVMNKETILVIQGDIAEIESQMSTMDSDISNIYIKIDALKTMDAELKKKLDEIENNLRASTEQNMTNVSNQFDSMSDKMQQIESQLLHHSYDAGTNTLYLYSD